MQNTKSEIVKVGGWSWQVNEQEQSLRFLGNKESFGPAVNTLNELSEQHMDRLATVVEYIEHQSDDAQDAA